ncbi:MAG: PrsW family glutamic-type intramembrane protease [Bacteroidales bacterium]|nr:PrsW family glutamic-type intramembrane protease [Bacteroidales bacterium]
MTILFISFAPIILILIYIYKRDKYEKEPMGLLAKALALGAIITLPIIFIEIFLKTFFETGDKIAIAFYDGFVVAALTEEVFKYLAFILLIWKNRNFNELFDGIIYAVFISLGFAAVENFFYVYGFGGNVGVLRAFTAVPAHALFGVAMGYYFGLARFDKRQQTKYLWLAILIPIMLHGFYDFFLMSENGILLLLFLPFIVYLWISGFKKMKKHSLNSVFKDARLERPEINLENME